MTTEQTLSDEYRHRIGQLLAYRDRLQPFASTDERAAVYESLADEVPTLLAALDALRPLRAAVLRYGRALQRNSGRSVDTLWTVRDELDRLALALAAEAGQG